MRTLLRLVISLCLFLPASLAWAGGAIQTNVDGLPLHWDVGSGLVYNPEQGALKSNGNYDRTATLKLLNDAFNAWAILPGFDLPIFEGAPLDDGGDVNQSNFSQFLPGQLEPCYPDIFGGSGGDCLTPIIFDESGEILDAMFGKCAKFSILGFAGFDDVDDGSGDPARLIVRRGQALFSGACLEPPVITGGCGECQRVLSDEEIKTIVTHEAGHLMGIDHSQVNPEAFSACSNSTDGCPPELSVALPIMFPILVKGALMGLHRDDEAYAQRLYGDPTQDTCSVTGSVFANDSATELRGAEVVAINVAPDLDLTDRISFVSGAGAPRFNNSKDQGNCRENCGFYRITGLTPGETYQLCAQKINTRFVGGSSIEPVLPPFQAFSDICPEGLTVFCECNGSCPEFTGMDIITDADPDDIDTDFLDTLQDTFGTSSGGCNLHRPRRPPLWPSIKKSLVKVVIPAEAGIQS